MLTSHLFVMHFRFPKISIKLEETKSCGVHCGKHMQTSLFLICKTIQPLNTYWYSNLQRWSFIKVNCYFTCLVNINFVGLHLCCMDDESISWFSFNINVMRFLWIGSMGVSNTNYNSKLFINADLPEVKKFRQRYPYSLLYNPNVLYIQTNF